MSDEALKLLREWLRSGVWRASVETRYPAADRKPAGTAIFPGADPQKVQLVVEDDRQCSKSQNDKNGPWARFCLKTRQEKVRMRAWKSERTEHFLNLPCTSELLPIMRLH
jgi:hypothetical protein